MSGKAKAPTVTAFESVCEGPAASVKLSPGVMGEYEAILAGTDKLAVQRRTHLKRYFEIFCSTADYRRQLSDEKFKKEGNFPDGAGGTVAVSAFKVRQWRLYGAVLAINGKRCFVGVRVDSAKKQDKADQDLLKRAAKDIATLSEYRPGGGE